MLRKGPAVSPTLAASIICLVVGGALGFYAKSFLPEAGADTSRTVSQPPMGGGGMPPQMGGMGGMGGGGGGFGGFGGPPSGGQTLARLVSGLDTVQKTQGKGLTPQQTAALLPLLQKIKTSEKIPGPEAEKHTAAIRKLLTDEQRATLDGLQPQRGGFGGAGGGGRGAGGRPGGSPGGPSGGGGFGGMPPDPDRPFASERNQRVLDSLIAQVGGKP